MARILTLISKKTTGLILLLLLCVSIFEVSFAKEMEKYYQIIIDNNLFHPLGWEPEKPKAPFALVGTVISVGIRKALLRRLDNSQIYYVTEGDVTDNGFTIRVIRKGVVRLDEGGNEYIVNFEGGDIATGVICDWWVIGPFPSPSDKGFDIVYPPENKVDLSAVYDGDGRQVSWQPVTTWNPNGIIDLLQVFGEREHVVAYAYAQFETSQALEAEMTVRSDDGVKVFLNGSLVHSNNVFRAIEAGPDQFPVRLRKGINYILLKITQGAFYWKFRVQVLDKEGKACSKSILTLTSLRKTQ